MARRGIATDGLSDDDILNMMKLFGEMFRDSAPLTAEQAATIILEGVRAGKWRILVGDDARALDEAVRSDPETDEPVRVPLRQSWEPVGVVGGA